MENGVILTVDELECKSFLYCVTASHLKSWKASYLINERKTTNLFS